MSEGAAVRFLTLLFLCLAGIGLGADRADAQLKKGGRFERQTDCLDCHEEMASAARFKHAPLAGGDCTSCHKPHGLVGALRLTQEVPGLCLDCHPSDGLQLEAAHRHPQVDNCSTCHDPHGSDHPALLISAERELCLK